MALSTFGQLPRAGKDERVALTWEKANRLAWGWLDRSVLAGGYPLGAGAADQDVQGHLEERAGEVGTRLDGLAVGAERGAADLGQGDAAVADGFVLRSAIRAHGRQTAAALTVQVSHIDLVEWHESLLPVQTAPPRGWWLHP